MTAPVSEDLLDDQPAEKAMRAVTLLGTGIMGGGMAGRLLEAGYDLTVWNRSPGRTEPLVEAGARLAASPREAAASAEVVISMVADDGASRSVWLGEDGVLASVPAGAVLVESSTLSPEWVRELATAAETRGCAFLDAPVTGSRVQAQSGQLLFLVGGAEEALARVREVLMSMARGVVHLGPTGSGAFVKLVNNFVCGVQVAAIAEAVAMIETSGLDPSRAMSILAEGAPGSPMVKAVSTRMLSRDPELYFAVDLMAKDLSYAHGLADTQGVPLLTAGAALEVFRRASQQGFGDHDISAVVEPLRSAGEP